MSFIIIIKSKITIIVNKKMKIVTEYGYRFIIIILSVLHRNIFGCRYEGRVIYLLC